MLSLGLVLPSGASEPQREIAPQLLEIGSVPIDRRSELKRTLKSSSNYLIEPEERRRLSSDERNLLSRELRETLSDLYEQPK